MNQTFAELQKNLYETQGRRALLMHLVDTLEMDFCAQGDRAPKKTILMDDKVPVGHDVIDTVVTDLLKEIAELEEHTKSIMNATLASPKSEAKTNENVQ